jgi:tetratricopeptide (TPR) repeat protein/predicted Ser/Thr protein kinase
MTSDPSSDAATTLGSGESAAPSDTRAGFGNGESVGRYIVLHRIGAGGMGVVYAAYDPKLDRKVAIKVMHGRRGGRDGTRGQERLAREAKTLARLNHPNVVTINDVGMHEGRVFLAMDIIEGRTLRAWFDTRPPWREVVRVMLEAGRGLAAAHESGLVHRDFKPDNVMLGADGRVVVMDFGLAHPITPTQDEHAPKPAAPGALVGTPLYMAPEQFSGAAIGPATDVFAFCVVLWEGLHGERPFPGTTAVELAREVSEGLVRAPPVAAAVPPALRRIALRGLAVDPDDRWPSMQALLLQLARDPAAPRRRMLGVAGIVATASAIAGWHALAQARSEAACREAVGSIEATWNPERADEIDLALLRTGVPYAGDVFERARAGLDDARDAWVDEREHLCEGAPDLEAPRARGILECLAHARAELTALTDLLATADAAVVPHATRMVAALPSARRCPDRRAGSELAASPTRAQQLAPEQRARLSRSSARRSAGRFEEALADAEHVLAEAAASGDRLGRTWADWAAAGALDGLGRYEEAATRYESAFYGASELDDMLAVRAAGQLVWVTGMRLGRHDDALKWYRTAVALVERLGMRDEPELAEVLNAAGAVHEARGEYDEALAAHERALEIRVAVFGPDHASVALSLNNIAMVHQARGELDPALSIMERALEITRRVDGPIHPDVAMMMGNLGNLHFTRGELDAALELQNGALAIEDVTLGPEHPRLARTILNLGVLQLGREEWEPALSSFRRALAMQERTLGPDHLDVAATLNNIGNVHLHAERHDEALAAYERALAIRTDALGPVHQRVGTLHNNIGDVHRARGDLERAEASYAVAADVLERALGAEHPLVGFVLSNLGGVQADRGDAAAAVATLERAVALLEASKGDPAALAKARSALAETIARRE